MDRYCQNPLCENDAVKEVPVSVAGASDQKRSLCAACEEVYTWGVQHGQMSKVGLQIDPPPKERGPEPLYHVVYMIDVNASNAHKAAACVSKIMRDPASMRPVLDVLEAAGRHTRVDLSQE